MKSLDDIVKELEEIGFRLLFVRIMGSEAVSRGYVRTEGQHTGTIVSFTTVKLPPEDEEDNEDEEGGEVLEGEEREFALSRLRPRFSEAEALLFVDGLLPLPKWFKEELYKRREVMP